MKWLIHSQNRSYEGSKFGKKKVQSLIEDNEANSPFLKKKCTEFTRSACETGPKWARLSLEHVLLDPGGGSGIGRAVCQRLASEGASVVVADISPESAHHTVGSLRSDLRGQGHVAAAVDVSSKESVKKLLTSIQVWGECRSIEVAQEVVLAHQVWAQLDLFLTSWAQI